MAPSAVFPILEPSVLVISGEVIAKVFLLFKRRIKSNGIKVNDKNYNENNFSLSNYASGNKIKISVGKKKIGFIKII